MKPGDLGEFGLISRIASASKQGVGVIAGIGDDAAVTALIPGMQLLTSTDMLLEDVHFRRAWHDPYRLGRKSLAVNISDIAAMGGIPRWALLSLAIPADISIDFLDEFTRGFLAVAGEHGVSLVGGDTCTSKRGFLISVTIMGEQFPDLVLRRSGAMPDDDIWVTGTLGDAALGLKMLEKNIPSPLTGEGQDGGEVGIDEGGDSFTHPPTPSRQGRGSDYIISRLLDPTPRVSTGLALAGSGLATAMIDLSDGLLADFGHIAEMSGVGGCISLEKLPFSANFVAVASTIAADPLALALSGGEDYELCFTSPQTNRKKIVACMKKCGIEAAAVGIVTRLPGVVAVLPDGTPYTPHTQGFKHLI